VEESEEGMWAKMQSGISEAWLLPHRPTHHPYFTRFCLYFTPSLLLFDPFCTVKRGQIGPTPTHVHCPALP